MLLRTNAQETMFALFGEGHEKSRRIGPSCEGDGRKRWFIVFLVVLGGLFADSSLVAGSDGVELRDIAMQTRPGCPPGGFSSKQGWPFPLSAAVPAAVRVPPVGSSVLYGEIPLAGTFALLAIRSPSASGGPAILFVDKNGDGDFSNDTPSEYRGVGTFGSAASLELDVRRPDGTSFPYTIWLWSSLGHPQGAGTRGFNLYATCVKQGTAQVCCGTVCKSFTVTVCDSQNTGIFDTDKIYIDWNKNGAHEDAECLKLGAACSIDGTSVKLVKIHPFADTVTLEIRPEKTPEAGHRDVLTELAQEPVAGNRPPALGADLDGNETDLMAFRGRVVLVDFWATWCNPCLKELPQVKKAYERFHDRGFEIIGISLDQDSQILRTFLAREGIHWTQICDGKGWSSDLVGRWHVKGIPATFLIGRDGRIVDTRQRGDALLNAIEKEISRNR